MNCREQTIAYVMNCREQTMNERYSFILHVIPCAHFCMLKYVSVGPRVTPEDRQISYSLTFGTGGAHARYSLLVDLSQSHML